MTFTQPLWLLAGLLSCLSLALLFHLLQKRRRLTLENFASQQLIDRLTRNVSRTRRKYKNVLLLFAVFLLFAALARPQYGFEWVDVKRKGIDLLFALDTSKSMLAEDIKPNRLKRAHFAILDFVQRLDGDRVGLLPFAGSSFLMCPLTMDYEAFEQSLTAVTTDIIPRGGTNLEGVIEAAATILTNGANHKILIILTDGENLEGDALAAAEKYGQEGLTIYTVGVGTSSGELIPVPGGKGFIKDSSGKYVTSKLDETALTKIAELTGGIYAPLGGAGEGLESIYQQKLSLIPKEELAERRHKIPIDRFEWPLAGALVFLVIELLLGERKKNGQGSFQPLFAAFKKTIKRKKEIGALVILLLLAVQTAAKASTGEDAFAAEDYLGAAEYYRQQLEKSPDSPELQYNFGASSYKNNMYDDAIEAFNRALKSEDLQLQKRAYFNLGNSHFQKGMESQQGDPKATVEEWKQAISSMDSVLKLAPEDEKAQNNRTVIEKKLEELEKQQKDQPQDQQNQDGQDNQQDQDQNSQDGESKEGEGEDNQEQKSGSNDTGEPESQQQDPPGDDKKDDTTESSESPQPINEVRDDEKSQEQKDKEQAQQDALRQKEGKMTREEAERLLNALKNQEGELNFIPSGRAADNDTEKDW
ncbi:MAG: Ca-activated chloride channel family protein [Desulforhopalus sp.]|jgi:Ca-activated chloride channel family protein